MLNTYTQHSIKSLKTHRDELLASMPMANDKTRQSWLRLEEKWDELLYNVRAVAHDDLASHGGTERTMAMLIAELESGYTAIRDTLH